MAHINRWRRITADTLTIDNGTLISGDISDTQIWDDNAEMTIREVTGVPGIRVTITFANVGTIQAVSVLGNYKGSTTHCVDIEIWNYTTSTWVQIGSFSTKLCPSAHTNWVFDDKDYISSGASQVRLNHSQSGTNSHYLYLRYIALLY